MSEYREYGMFIKGEIRVDGWKSDWRKEQEELRKDKVFIPMIHPAVSEPKKYRVRTLTKPQYNKQYMRERRTEAIKNKQCADCYHVPAREGKTTCQPCQDKRTAREMKRYNARKAA